MKETARSSGSTASTADAAGVALFDAKGAVVEVAEQVEERELPKPALAAIRSHRRAIYVSGMKVTRGRNVEHRGSP